MPNAAVRSFGIRGATWRIAFFPSMRAWGRNSNARNSMICGMASGAVVQRPVQLRKFCWNSNTSPMSRPPAKVSGRLFSRPMIAAANAAMISNVSVCTSRVASSSARKMPATAAIDEPSAHENIETRPGLMPLRPASSRLSTTARMATPRRVRESRIFETDGERRGPTTIVMKRDHGINVWPIWKPLVPKKRSMCRVSCGSQIRPARPMRMSMRPTVVTICATSGASDIARIRSRSMIAPMSGAATNTVSSSATKVWMPQLTWSSQNTYAMNMPIAPWAKLKMPGRGVGDHEAGRGDRVDRAEGDADDQPEEDRVQGDRVAGPGGPARPRPRRSPRRPRRRPCGGSRPNSARTRSVIAAMSPPRFQLWQEHEPGATTDAVTPDPGTSVSSVDVELDVHHVLRRSRTCRPWSGRPARSHRSSPASARDRAIVVRPARSMVPNMPSALNLWILLSSREDRLAGDTVDATVRLDRVVHRVAEGDHRRPGVHTEAVDLVRTRVLHEVREHRVGLALGRAQERQEEDVDVLAVDVAPTAFRNYLL